MDSALGTDDLPALRAVLPRLRCPLCRLHLALDHRQLVCPSRHSFDLARQGYVNLTTGGSQAGTADTPAMVAARQDFLGRGHLQPLSDALARAVQAGRPLAPDDGLPLLLDLAGGTGHHLAAVLEAQPAAVGVCLDLSAPALRRAARAHPRAAAVGADAWQPLPLVDACATAVLNVFGPRDVAEIQRVLAPDGVLVTATPGPQHLAELVAPLGMLRVDPDKARRHAVAFDRFDRVGTATTTYVLALGHRDVLAVVSMGPTASHRAPDALAAAVAALPPTVEVTVEVDVSTYRRGGVGPA